jgi:TatD DNase family protein
MKPLFDSHAHYYDRRFEELEGGADALLSHLFKGEVGYIVNVGTDPENSRVVIAEAARWRGMYAAVGIHPGDCQWIEDVEPALDEIERMIMNKNSRHAQKIVALGEIGLDYHYDDTDKKKQAYFFDRQLEMARKYEIPVIIHDREAHGDSFDTICRYPDVTGVFHSYSGSAEMARDLVRRGWYISFSGVATFKNAPKVREAIAAVPNDRILIETDAPYLAPVPHRGKCNHSGLAYYTAAAVATVKGIDADSVCRITAENAKKLFQI